MKKVFTCPNKECIYNGCRIHRDIHYEGECHQCKTELIPLKDFTTHKKGTKCFGSEVRKCNKKK